MTGPVISTPGVLPSTLTGPSSTGPIGGAAVAPAVLGAHHITVGGAGPSEALHAQAKAPPGTVSGKVSRSVHVVNSAISRQALLERIGSGPKDNIKLGPFTYRRSTGYRDIQEKLDTYQSTFTKSTAASGSIASVLQARDALKALEGALQRYERSSSHTHKAEMRGLLKEVQGELAVVQDGLVGLGPEDVEYAKSHAYPHELVKAYSAARMPINDATRLTFTQLVPGVADTLGHGNVNEVFRVDVRGSDGHPMAAVFKPEIPGTGVGAKACGIDGTQARWACRNVATYLLDQQLGFGLVPKTGLALINENIGTVMALVGGHAPQAKGEARIKLSPDQLASMPADPKTLADRLKDQGFRHGGKIVGTELVIELGRNGNFPDEEWETMPRHDRSQLERTARVALDFENPELRAGLNRLQWLDILTGQIDRHAGNYFVSHDSDGAPHVHAIDNDLAFGAKFHTVEELTSSQHVCKLPELVDLATCEALERLRPEQLPALLGGLLSEAEIQATAERLGDIHVQLAKLRSEQAVIGAERSAPGGPLGWRGPEANRRLGIIDPPVSFQLSAKIAELERAEPPKGKAAAITKMTDGFNAATKKASYLARDQTEQEVARMTPELVPLLEIAKLARAGA